MKKKLYIEPSMEVVFVATNQILCGSITVNGDNLNTTLGDDEFGSNETINAPEFSW